MEKIAATQEATSELEQLHANISGLEHLLTDQEQVQARLQHLRLHLPQLEQRLSVLAQEQSASEARIAEILSADYARNQAEDARSHVVPHAQALLKQKQAEVETARKYAVWARDTDNEQAAIKRVEEAEQAVKTAQNIVVQSEEDVRLANLETQQQRDAGQKALTREQAQLQVIGEQITAIEQERQQTFTELGYIEQGDMAYAVWQRVHALIQSREEITRQEQELRTYLAENADRLRPYPQHLDQLRTLLPEMEDTVAHTLMQAIRLIDAILINRGNDLAVLSRLPSVRHAYQNIPNGWKRLFLLSSEELYEIATTGHAPLFHLPRKRRELEMALQEYRAQKRPLI